MRPVGRTRKNDLGLPKRVYLRHGAYYHVSPEGKWRRLGATRGEMYRSLAELEAAGQHGTMDALIARYLQEVTPRKAKASQEKDHQHAVQLRAVFGPALPQDVRPTDVARYLDTRSAKIAANREKALLSHVFSMGMRWGVVDANPCRGVARNPEKPRDRYPTHQEVEAVGKHAAPWLVRFLRIAYLTGQRPGDVLSLTRPQVTDEGLTFRQAKTGKKLLVEWTPALREAVQEALNHAGEMMLFSYRRKPYSWWALNSAWRRAVAAAIEKGDLQEAFQLRDLRAKSASDGGDKGLLGHASKETTRRVYLRVPTKVKPVQ